MSTLAEEMTLSELEKALWAKKKERESRVEALAREHGRLEARLEEIDRRLEAAVPGDLRRLMERLRDRMIEEDGLTRRAPRASSDEIREAVLDVLNGRLLSLREIHKGVRGRADHGETSLAQITREVESLIGSKRVVHVGHGLHEKA